MAVSFHPSRHPRRSPALLVALAALLPALLAGCQPRPSAQWQELQQRQEQLDLKLQQLEQKLNRLTPAAGADKAGKPPAGPVKSITLRSGSDDDRLRIYWADGSSSDLPCTKEQGTWACG